MIVGPIYWGAFPGETLEKVMAVLLGQDHPLALRRTPDQGDGGVDVLVETDGGWHVYQVKGFTGRMTAARKKKVERSLSAAIADPRLSGRPIERWTLAVPIDPTATEQAWFDDLKRSTTFPCNWAGESPFWHGLAARHPHVIDYYLCGGRARVEARAAALLSAVEPSSGRLTAEDVAGRLALLASSLNRESPHYRYDFHVGSPVRDEDLPADTAVARSRRLDDGSWLTTIVRWRYRSAPEDAPIRGVANVTVCDPERGIDITEALADFRRFGTAIDIPGGALSVDMESVPPGFETTLPAGSGRIGPMLVQGGGLRRTRLRVVDPANRSLAEIGLATKETSRGDRGVQVLASDDAGVLDLQIRFWSVEDADRFEGTVHFEAHVGAIHTRPVTEVLPTLRLLRHFTTGNELHWLEEYGTGVLARNPFPDGVSNLISEGLLQFLEDLDVIQNHVRGTVIVPASIDDETSMEVARAAYILRNGKLEGTWNEFSLQLDEGTTQEEVLAKLVNGGHLALEGEMALEIAGQRYELGLMSHVVSRARLAEDQPTDGRSVNLVPIDDEGTWVQRLGPLVQSNAS